PQPQRSHRLVTIPPGPKKFGTQPNLRPQICIVLETRPQVGRGIRTSPTKNNLVDIACEAVSLVQSHSLRTIQTIADFRRPSRWIPGGGRRLVLRLQIMAGSVPSVMGRPGSRACRRLGVPTTLLLSKNASRSKAPILPATPSHCL